MGATGNSLESRFHRLQAALAAVPGGAPPQLPAEVMAFVTDARRAARAGLAIPILERCLALGLAVPHRLLGFAYAEEQRMADAVRAFERAMRLNPADFETALLHAQASLDAGYPAAALFEQALSLVTADPRATSGWAAALAAEGRGTAAESVLVDALRRQPDWLVGHRSLATLRITSGNARDALAGYAHACRQLPRHLPLRMAWVGALLQVQDWSSALAVIADGESIFGVQPEFSVARTLIAAESNDCLLADALFESNAALRDDTLRFAHLRHQLRSGRVEQAEKIAEVMMSGPFAPAVWPYLSLIWRVRGDPRAQWLDGAPASIHVYDLDYGAAELEQLAVLLRRLQTTSAPHPEQSVRGGIQTDTDRQLFHRAEPEIQKLRAKVLEAVRGYIASLPAPVPGHPLLGTPRAQILFSGSWSVSLRAGGYHASHTHPRGWISSALYVSLPQRQALGSPPAGWIRFGLPPDNFNLNLPAYRDVEPKPGRLVLFPATLWHRTEPFPSGERLVVAFDVMRPRH